MINRKTSGTKDNLCWCGTLRGQQTSGNWQNVPRTTFTLSQCADCQTIRTVTCEYDDYIEGLYLGDLSLRHKNSVATIKEHCSGKVLDIGCNCGEILNELRDDDSFTELAGIDANEKAVSLGAEKFKLNLKNIDVEDLLRDEDEKYDTVVMIHTFEHILNPVKFLKKIQYLFKESGQHLLYLCVPNIENANIFNFGALDPREHYWHFTESSLLSLIKYVYPTAEIIFSGKSHIWSNNEQLELVVKVPSLETES